MHWSRSFGQKLNAGCYLITRSHWGYFLKMWRHVVVKPNLTKSDEGREIKNTPKTSDVIICGLIWMFPITLTITGGWLTTYNFSTNSTWRLRYMRTNLPLNCTFEFLAGNFRLGSGEHYYITIVHNISILSPVFRMSCPKIPKMLSNKSLQS